MIKRYKVTLNIGVGNIVKADGYTQNAQGRTRFYSGDEVVAEFPTASLTRVEELEASSDDVTPSHVPADPPTERSPAGR